MRSHADQGDARAAVRSDEVFNSGVPTGCGGQKFSAAPEARCQAFSKHRQNPQQPLDVLRVNRWSSRLGMAVPRPPQASKQSADMSAVPIYRRHDFHYSGVAAFDKNAFPPSLHPPVKAMHAVFLANLALALTAQSGISLPMRAAIGIILQPTVSDVQASGMIMDAETAFRQPFPSLKNLFQGAIAPSLARCAHACPLRQCWAIWLYYNISHSRFWERFSSSKRLCVAPTGLKV